MPTGDNNSQPTLHGLRKLLEQRASGVSLIPGLSEVQPCYLHKLDTAGSIWCDPLPGGGGHAPKT